MHAPDCCSRESFPGQQTWIPLPFSPQLTLPLNSYTITNTVTCQTQLSLAKVVAGRDRPPSPSRRDLHHP